jgi:GDP-L-fucose synthase
MSDSQRDAAYAGKTILVTGATGLYGRNLVPRLLEKGAKVRAVARRAPNPPLPPEVEFRAGDLKEPGFARQAAKGCQGLFHMAGTRGSIGIQIKRAAEMLHDNTLSCFNALNAAREAGVERAVYVSTVSVYPPGERYVEDQAWSANPHPGNEFVAWSKRMAEKLIEAFDVQYGAKNFAILRPVNTFGPWDDFDPQTALVVPALIGRALSGENPLTVWGDGNAVRDFLYVEDAVDGLLAGYERGLGQGPINLGSGRGYTIREVVAAILRHAPPGTDVRWDTTKPAGEARKVADTKRAETILGFTPKIGLEEGIARTIAWYRARG